MDSGITWVDGLVIRYNIDEISKNYYDKIVSKLTEEEKKYFLAFCQHYGIPTNLIDFSYSPLIALFFSCQGKQPPTFNLAELIGSATIDDLKTDSSIQNKGKRIRCNPFY